MKILLTHRYFWPDSPPYAAMLRSIGDHLAAAGHDVHVFASKPSYRGTKAAPGRECLGGLQVHRVPVFAEKSGNPLARAANVAIYCASLFVHVLRTGPDVVMASTFPPVVAAWSASAATRLCGARFVYHMMDVHPEVSRYSGGRLGRGLPYRVLRWLDTRTMRRAAAIVVLSEDMAATVRARPGGDRLPVHVINNFLLEDFDAESPPPPELVKSEGRRRVIFAGNLGRFQNLPLLAEGIARLFPRHPELELFFLGDGEALKGLKDRWGDHPQVRFGPFLPFAQARQLIAGADVGLVSLTPDIYRVSYPSKALTYLGLGVPILALVEPESALARDLADAGLGAAPETPTPEAIAAALEGVLQRPDMRPGIARWYEEHASRARIMARWDGLFAEIAADTKARRP